MVSRWTKIDKVLYENRHRDLPTMEIARLSNEPVGNCHAKLKIMFIYGDVTRKKRVLLGKQPQNIEVRWKLKPGAYGRVLERLKKLDD